MFEIIARDRQSTVLGRLELTGQKLVRIGRGRDCDFRLHNAAVSRNTANSRLIDDGQWVYRDLGSTHGSFINDARWTGMSRSARTCRCAGTDLAVIPRFGDPDRAGARRADPRRRRRTEIRIIARNRSLDRASQTTPSPKPPSTKDLVRPRNYEFCVVLALDRTQRGHDPYRCGDRDERRLSQSPASEGTGRRRKSSPSPLLRRPGASKAPGRFGFGPANGRDLQIP